MSKNIILLLFLLNLYACEEEAKNIIFKVNPNIDNEKEFNVDSGEEFTIELHSFSSSWVLLNKKELKSLTFIKTNYKFEPVESGLFGPQRKGHVCYIFKANSKTEEPALIKFTDTYYYLKQANPEPKFIIKINVN